MIKININVSQSLISLPKKLVSYMKMAESEENIYLYAAR